MKKLKHLLYEISKRGAIHITMGSFITKFVGMMGSIFVVRILSKNDYGLVGYVENIYGYVFIFAGLGLSNAMLRYIVKVDDNRKRTYYRYICGRSVVINICLVVAMLVINTFIDYPKDFTKATYLLSVLALMIPFQDLLNDGLCALRSSFKTREYAYWSLVVSSILVLGRIAGGWFAGANGVIWSRLIINGIFAIALFIYAKKLFARSETSIPLTKNEKKNVFGYSVQYMITNGLWAIFMLNDVQVLSMYVVDSTIVADYKVACTLPAAVSILSTSIGVFVAPYFTKNEGDNAWIRKYFKQTCIINMIAIGAVTVAMILMARPLICLFYGEKYLNIVGLMRILAIASFFNAGLRYTTANILACMGKVKYNMVVSVAGICFQLLLDIVLVQILGQYGIAISSCIVYLVMGIALLIIFYRNYYRDL